MAKTAISRRSFYAECFKRASRGKLLWIEGISGLLALFAVPFGLWIWPDSEGAMNWAPLAIFGAVFSATFAVGMVTAPYWIYRELEEKKNALEGKLDNRKIRQRAMTRLWALRKEGVSHRNKGITGHKAFKLWLAEFKVWRNKVLREAKKVSPNFSAWLETLDRMGPSPLTSQPVHGDHRRYRDIMSEILMRIEEFLKAEMLNKDIERTGD